MLSFNVVDLGNFWFRCVLGEEVFFDFTISQLDLFGYDHFYSYLQQSIGNKVYSVRDNKEIGDLAAVRYLKPEDCIWVLIRNGIRGEIYVKEL